MRAKMILIKENSMEGGTSLSLKTNVNFNKSKLIHYLRISRVVEGLT